MTGAHITMLCSLHQALHRSHKAIAAAVIMAWLLSVASVCSAQTMGALLPTPQANEPALGAHAMHQEGHHIAHSSAAMPCCAGAQDDSRELIAELCCDPIDGIVPTVDKSLFGGVFTDQIFIFLWPIFKSPLLILQPLIKPPTISSFPARHLTLAVQLI